MIETHIPGNIGQFDHARMIEDLAATSPGLSRSVGDGNSLRAPLSLLARFGGDLLYAHPSDAGGWRLRSNATLLTALSVNDYCYAFEGNLRVSWLHVALILGRRDLHDRFVDHRGLNIERAIQWLVLYGIDEHALWRFLDLRFCRQLRARTIERLGGLVSPLDLILTAERPDLLEGNAPGSAGFDEHLDEWLEVNGLHEYHLFWLFGNDEYDRLLARRLVARRIGRDSEGALDDLLRAHAERRIDVWVETRRDRERILKSVMRVPSEPLELSVMSPRDEKPLSRDPIAPNQVATSEFDFHAGGSGLELSTAAILGIASSGGTPVLSSSITLFFGPPISFHSIILLDIMLVQPTSRLLVLAAGEPIDVFPAAALGERPAKVHISGPSLFERLTLKLVILGAALEAPGEPLAWLRSLSFYSVLI